MSLRKFGQNIIPLCGPSLSSALIWLSGFNIVLKTSSILTICQRYLPVIRRISKCPSKSHFMIRYIIRSIRKQCISRQLIQQDFLNTVRTIRWILHTCSNLSLSSKELRTLFHPGKVSIDPSFDFVVVSRIHGHQCRCSSTALKVGRTGSCYQIK